MEQEAKRAVRLAVLAGLIATIVMTGLMLWGRLSFGTPLIPELLAERLFVSVPMRLFLFFIQLLSGSTKYIAFGFMVLVHLAIGSGFAGLFIWVSRFMPGPNLWVKAATFGGVLWAISLFTLLPLGGAGLLGRRLPIGPGLASLSLFLYHMVYAAVLVAVYQGMGGKPTEGLPSGNPGRRRFLIRASAGLLALALPSLLELARKGQAFGQELFARIKGLSKEVTPNDVFYTVSKNVFNPEVNVKKWQLEITGLVNKPFTLNYDQLKALPSVTQHATLICISNEVGGDLIGNALWKGVPVADLLRTAGVKPEAKKIVLHAYDGYTDSVTVTKGMEKGTIVAYEMNGVPLNSSHGYPVRLIVPDIYGMKNVKWITKIELTAQDYKGFWQNQGWSDEAIIKTTSRIDVPDDRASIAPGKNYIAGIAFAGARGIRQIEISVDGGKSWHKALVKKALSPYSWILWAWEWDSLKAAKGQNYQIKVRATDGQGKVQDAQVSEVLPDGASGLHTITVTLK